MTPERIVYWLQQMLNGLQLGSIYALIALGYTMVYGILQMINFAHGDFFMVGAFAAASSPPRPGLSVRAGARPRHGRDRGSSACSSSGSLTGRSAGAARLGHHHRPGGRALPRELHQRAQPVPEARADRCSANRPGTLGGVTLSSIQVWIIVLAVGAGARARPPGAPHQGRDGDAGDLVGPDDGAADGRAGERDHLAHVRASGGARRRGRDASTPRLPDHRSVHGRDGRAGRRSSRRWWAGSAASAGRCSGGSSSARWRSWSRRSSPRPAATSSPSRSCSWCCSPAPRDPRAGPGR